MKIKSLYLAPQQVSSGSLAVTTGLMQLLKGKFPRVAFFKPIINKQVKNDNDINFVIDYFSLNIEEQYTYGLTLTNALEYISKNQIDNMIEIIIKKFKYLEENYDFVFLKGITQTDFITSVDINHIIAKNLNLNYISVINGYKKDLNTIYEEISIDAQSIQKSQCTHFATFINRVDKEYISSLKNYQLNNFTLFALPEISKLDLPTIKQIKEELECEVIFGNDDKLNTTIGGNKIGAMTLENLLSRVEDKDLVIVPADRAEVIVGLILSIYSQNTKKISAILLTGNLQLSSYIYNLLDGLKNIDIPILSTKYDTYDTANKVNNIKAIMSSSSISQVALALGNFFDNVKANQIFDKLNIQNSLSMTPLMFEYNLFERAKKNTKTIVLPESTDDRILKAVEILLLRDIVKIILLGNSSTILHRSELLNIDISKAVIINPTTSKYVQEFTNSLYNIRKHKGVTMQMAHDMICSDYNVFGTMMVHLNYASGMVSGAVGSTANTVRPALQIIKTKQNTSIVSSVFFMCLDTKVLVYGDCALNQDPDISQLAQIALSSANTAKAFGIDPKVAMLSYSTGTSGSGEDVDKVAKATKLVKELNPNLLVEGPIQYDAAVDKDVAKKKLPNSKVAGEANVFIFPDLNTGNNTYKAVQRSSNAIAIGPILQGLNKPINDLSRGCKVEDIVNTVAITAIQGECNK